MKIDTDFPYYSANWFGRTLEFTGRGVVHLQETELVVEGGLPKFFIPFAGSIYSALLSTPSSRAIPYSRIQQVSYSGYWLSFTLFKGFMALFIGLLVVAGTIFTLNNRMSAEELTIHLGVLWGFFLLLMGLLLINGRRTHEVVFSWPDGSTRFVYLVLATSDWTEIERFTQRLEQFIREAREFQAAQTKLEVAA